MGDWLLELLHSHNDQSLTKLGMPWLQELMHSHNVQSLIILGMSGQQELMTENVKLGCYVTVTEVREGRLCLEVDSLISDTTDRQTDRLTTIGDIGPAQAGQLGITSYTPPIFSLKNPLKTVV